MTVCVREGWRDKSVTSSDSTTTKFLLIFFQNCLPLIAASQKLTDTTT